MTLVTFGHKNSRIELREMDSGDFQIVRKLTADTDYLIGTMTLIELEHLKRMINSLFDEDAVRSALAVGVS